MTTRRALIAAAASTVAGSILAPTVRARVGSVDDLPAAAPHPPARDGRRHGIAVLMYPAMTLLDLVGPLHFFSGIPGAQVHLVTNQRTLAPVTSDNRVAMVPTVTMENCPSDIDVLFVPGGTAGTIAAARDGATLDFIRRTSQRARFVTSVCTGSIVLGAAGLLHARRATSHWAVVADLERFGATPVHERVVRDGPLVTAAGVSAGLDLGIVIADQLGGRLAAEALVLISEYAPQPLLTGGTPSTARPEVTELLTASLQDFVRQVRALPSGENSL